MIAARLKHIFFTLLFTEILSLTIAFMVSCQQLHRLSSGELTLDQFSSNLVFYLVPAYIFSLMGVLIVFYREITRFSGFHLSLTRMLFFKAMAVLIGFSLWFLVQSWLASSAAAALLILEFTATAMILIIISHVVCGLVFTRIYNRPENRVKVLVAGMNHRARNFCAVLQASPHLGIEVRGYIDTEQRPDADIAYAGGLDDLGDILRQEVIDVVFIFLPVRSFYDEIHNIIENTCFYGVTAHIIGNVFEAENMRKHSLCINDLVAMAFSSTTEDYFGLTVKRIMDVVIASVALIFLFPVFILLGLYILLVDGWPVIFAQDRAGYNKRVFKMYKFRTMVRDAEQMIDELLPLNEMDGPAFKISADPRLIRGGGFIRKYSLDELPQLWNVVRGEMSLVGPRPLSMRDYNLLSNDWQRKRFSMKPGLSCIWQTSGRNDVNFERWMLMDLEYIDTWSLGLDVIIMLKTVREVLRGGGR